MPRASSTSSSRLHDGIRLLLKAATLALAAGLSMLALLVGLPDGNDFAGATLDKHARLQAQDGPKVVFVGGSNLAFGLDSAAVEQALGVPVVNMGMNAWLGLRFMLNEVRGALRPGDTVVVALEYEAWFLPGAFDGVEGAGPDQLMLLKVRPASSAYLGSTTQVLGVARAIPYAAQQKTLRLLEAGLDRLQGQSPVLSLIERVETRGGFNRHGDLVSHLGVAWPHPLEPGIDLSRKQPDPRVLDLLREFHREMAAQGVTVLVVPPPAPESYYQQHRAAIDALFAHLRQGGPAGVPDAGRYAFPIARFFDNFNHLDAEGRALRTRQVIRDIGPLMPDAARLTASARTARAPGAPDVVASAHAGAP